MHRNPFRAPLAVWYEIRWQARQITMGTTVFEYSSLRPKNCTYQGFFRAQKIVAKYLPLVFAFRFVLKWNGKILFCGLSILLFWALCSSWVILFCLRKLCETYISKKLANTSEKIYSLSNYIVMFADELADVDSRPLETRLFARFLEQHGKFMQCCRLTSLLRFFTPLGVVVLLKASLETLVVVLGRRFCIFFLVSEVDSRGLAMELLGKTQANSHCQWLFPKAAVYAINITSSEHFSSSGFCRLFYNQLEFWSFCCVSKIIYFIGYIREEFQHGFQAYYRNDAVRVPFQALWLIFAEVKSMGVWLYRTLPWQ